MIDVDAYVENHGSLCLVRPQTAFAHDWLKMNTDGQWWGGGLAVEPRYVTDLVSGMREEGMTVEAV